MRIISEDQQARLKAATRRAVKAAGGGDSFQQVTRVSDGQLSKYGSASDEHHGTFMPLDVALEADIEAGAPIIATAMAAAQGFRLVRDDEPHTPKKLDFSDISTIGVTFADLQRAMHEALADDGEVDPAESRVIHRLGDRLARVLLEVMARA